MSVRSRLTMRCSVSRQSPSGDIDGWGHVIPQVENKVIESLPCWVWPRREVVVENKAVAYVMGRYGMLAARQADLRDGDVITEIRSRNGVPLYEGAYRVEAGYDELDHKHLDLEVVRAAG